MLVGQFWHGLRRMTTPRQLDLFSGGGESPPAPPDLELWTPLDPTGLSDRGLIAMIPRASQAEADILAREAVRRGLASAIPALEALCRRFTGFGQDREVTEQVAALAALTELGANAGAGGKAAAEAVARLFAAGSVRGPGMAKALDAAAALGCRLPPERIEPLLRDPEPAIRAAACRCARSHAGTIKTLIDLLTDLHPPVAHASAHALSRLGRPDGVGVLTRLLQTEPTAEIVAALAPIAGDDEIVRLGQTAMRHPDLAPAIVAALEDCEAPRAAIVAAGLRRRMGLPDGVAGWACR